MSEARKSLTAARLSWLEACAGEGSISALELRLATLLALQYAGQPRSLEKFEESGVPVAWPSQIGLADKLGCSRQAVSAAARRLAKRGLIQITPGQGRGHATEYGLKIKGKQPGGLLRKPYRQKPEAEKAIRRIPKGKDTAPEKATKLVAPFHSSQSINHIHSHSRGEDGDFSSGERKVRHPEFEKVFAMWPNPQKDHGKALGAWINKVVKPGHDPEKVLRRAKLWCEYWEDHGTRMIPYLGKWLAEAKWKQKPKVTVWEDMLSRAAKLSGEEGRFEFGVTYDPDSPD